MNNIVRKYPEWNKKLSPFLESCARASAFRKDINFYLETTSPPPLASSTEEVVAYIEYEAF